MLSGIHIPYLRFRAGLWYAIILLVIAGFTLPGKLVQQDTGRPLLQLPFEHHSVTADDGMATLPMVSEGRERHHHVSVRAKAKIPSFFKRSAATYAGSVFFHDISNLYTASLLRSVLLRPGNYLFLFRYTPF